MMEKIGNRFKNIRKLLNKSQSQFANELLITKQAVSNIETSKSAPSIVVLAKLQEVYGINLNYIVSGIGDMFLAKEESYGEIRKSLIQEVEVFLEQRGIV